MKDPIERYMGQDVCNFGYSFIVPMCNSTDEQKLGKLRDLIRRWNASAEANILDNITTHISELNGQMFVWL